MASTLKDIAKVLVDKHQLKLRDAENFTNAFVETVLEGLQNDRLVKIKGFGTFKLTAVRDRESVNVNTGERIVVSGHDKISFTPDAVMRDMVNKPFAQFETVVLADGVKFDDIKEEEVETETAESPAVDMPETPSEEIFSLIGDSANESEEAPAAAEPEPSNVVEEVTEVAEEEPATVVENSPEIVEDVSERAEEETKPEAEERVDETPEPLVKEEEPLVKEEEPLVKEEEPMVETSEPVVETPKTEVEHVAPMAKATPVRQSLVDELDNDSSDDDGNECKKIFILYALFSNVIFIGLAFVLGYLCCSNKWMTFGPEQVPEQEPAEVYVDTIDSVNQAKIDSMRNAALGITPEKKNEAASEKKTDSQPAVEQKKAEPKPAAEQKKAEQKPAEEQKKTAVSVDAGIPDQSQYNKDARVRTGAYYIIGTQATVKVKAGQTLSSISKTYLGSGMECYVEVYNGGVKTLTEGQTVKIPKLQLKKKKPVAK